MSSGILSNDVTAALIATLFLQIRISENRPECKQSEIEQGSFVIAFKLGYAPL